MAAGDSVVSICNIALVALGESPVTNVIPPDNNKRAIICAARYDDCRRFVLRNHPWNCAKTRRQLAANPVAPLFGFSNAYDIPGDVLRIVNLPELDQEAWVVEAGQILTDATAPLNAEVIFDLQDPTRFDPALVHAIAYTLCEEIAMPLTQSKSRRDDALAILAAKLDIGRLVGSQENSPKEWDEDVMLRSRQ